MNISINLFIAVLLAMFMFGGFVGFIIGYKQKTDKYVKMKIEEAEKQFEKMWSKDD